MENGRGVKESAISVIRALREHGHQAYLVGGCVRDLLLGREPGDYDVATSATPQQVMALYPQALAVGAQFGVVLVPFREGNIEVATFRNDGLYSDGRHPDQVSFSTSAQEDVQRRDFTVNGLLLDPIDGQKVLDYVGGQQDLQAGVIRTIGEPHRRFGEDKLRMLRAVRFAARFGYRVAPETLRAIHDLASQIHQVSRERIRDELTKMLTEGAARRAFELLDSSGLLQEVLPEVSVMKGIEQPPQFHPEGDVWTHTLLLLGGLERDGSATLAWGALLHDVGKPPTFRRAPDRIRFDNHADIGATMAREICSRLRMSNDDTDQIVAIVANHMKFPELPRMRQSTLKKFLRQDRFAEHLEMHRLDCQASHRDLTLYEFAKQKLATIPPEQIRPTPLITGDDLIAEGYAPGPEFRRILTLVEDAQLEGALKSKDEAIRFVRQHFNTDGAS
jgi:poly(A) polymerase